MVDRERHQKKLKDMSKALAFNSTKLDYAENLHQQQSTGNYSAIAEDILNDDDIQIPSTSGYESNS